MDPTSRNAMRSQTKNTGRRFFRMETTLARIDSILGNPEMCGPTSSGPEIRSVEAALTLLDDNVEDSETWLTWTSNSSRPN